MPADILLQAPWLSGVHKITMLTDAVAITSRSLLSLEIETPKKEGL